MVLGLRVLDFPVVFVVMLVVVVVLPGTIVDDVLRLVV